MKQIETVREIEITMPDERIKIEISVISVFLMEPLLKEIYNTVIFGDSLSIGPKTIELYQGEDLIWKDEKTNYQEIKIS